MKRFTQLYLQLDQTNKTLDKVSAIANYFREAAAADAAWALYFLSGQKLRQLVPTKLLRQWAAEEAGIEAWLFDECYEVVGDLAEAMALVLPDPGQGTEHSLQHWMQALQTLRNAGAEKQRGTVRAAWQELDSAQRFVLHKILTGSFRIGVSAGLLVRGLAEATGLPKDLLAHRLAGDWQPTADAYQKLCAIDDNDAHVSRPYPFFLAHPLETAPAETLGEVQDWQVEWKWDGIRAELIRRSGEVFLWSRGDELITERFPEIAKAADKLPDGVVLDGELVAWQGSQVMPFAELQRRIGRKQLTRKILTEVPAAFIAFDCLEYEGRDIRDRELRERRRLLEDIVSRTNKSASTESSKEQIETPVLRLSPLHPLQNWGQLTGIRESSRAYQTEGVMIKRVTSPYRFGRTRGDWWKWKIDPYTIDAVLIYAQRGHGKRATLYTDYTFAVWEQDQLVPFAKAYSGLTDQEINRVDQFIRQNTIERFGPVRSVKPHLVFELAFEDIRLSSRHKSGIAVRFPRIVRWRDDKTIQEADSLAAIKSLLENQPR